MTTKLTLSVLTTTLLVGILASPAFAQDPVQATGSGSAPNGADACAPPVTNGLASANDYVIGAADVLFISFWRDETMSGDVVVRPDGQISLPLLNDIQAAGRTPVELGACIAETATKFIANPTVSVVVKQINSRRVFIMGEVNNPGQYDLAGSMTVFQLIATAGGLLEYADKKNIVVVRTEAGRTLSYTVNYDEVSKGKNLAQDRTLRPGDRVIVR